jgi:hypothetical protein
MNKNYCGIFKVTEEDQRDPEASPKVVCTAIIKGPILAAQAGEIVTRAVDEDRHQLGNINVTMNVEIFEEPSSIPDDLRGVEPAFEDGDTKVWLIKP